MSDSFKNFSGYILAGGKSSRMGRDKAFLQLTGKTFIEHAYQTLEVLGKNPTKISLKTEQQAHILQKFLPVTSCVIDTYIGAGVLAGIHGSLDDCSTEFAMVLACDMPLVTKQVCENLCEIASKVDTDGVIPKQKDGRLQPLCAVYRVSRCLPKLEEMLEKKISYSANDFLKSISIFTVEQDKLDNSKNIFLNVNSLKDYESLLDQL